MTMTMTMTMTMIQTLLLLNMGTSKNVLSILQSCRRNKDLSEARRLHAYLLEQELESDPDVGNYLVPMLVDCGSLQDAHWVFELHPSPNHHSWNSLISGYIAAGLSSQAFHLYHKMAYHGDCLRPNRCTFLALLNACAKLKDAEAGLGVHADIVKFGLEQDLFNGGPTVGNTLVDVYGKCSMAAEACWVFLSLQVRDVVSWNALIAGYAEQNTAKEFNDSLQMMQSEGVCPNSVTLLCSLRACGSLRTILEIHPEIVKRSMEKECTLAGTLMDAYSKHGGLKEARHMFDRMKVRDTVSWATLIAAYTEHGLSEEALDCTQQMWLDDACPDSITFVCSLKACAAIGALNTGLEMHNVLTSRGFDKDHYVCNILVDMYVKCDSLVDAQQVFDRMSLRNSVSWNAIVAGYAQHKLDDHLLSCFIEMQKTGISADPVTFMHYLKACSTTGNFKLMQHIHARLVKMGLEKVNRVGNTLVDVYIKCCSFEEAHKVFDGLHFHDVVSWNALISGYAEKGQFEEIAHFLLKMRQDYISPDAVTFVASLKGCTTVESVETLKFLHAEISKVGLGSDLNVGNTLLDVYIKFGLLMEAQQVFSKLPERDVVSWTALITGYAEHGLGQEVAKCFHQLHFDGMLPDLVTIICSLRACSTIEDLDTGREIHAQITKRGLDTMTSVGNTMVGLYNKCSSLTEAQKVFDKMPVRDAVSWNALIVGYSEHEHDDVVLCRFKQMQLLNIPVDPVSLVCCLKACGTTGVLEVGHEIHTEIMKLGLERDPSVGSMLVEMYARCSSLAEVQNVFDMLPVQDVVCWTALIKAYSENHEGASATQCFADMQRQGVMPDVITFTCLLAACSQASLLHDGEHYFDMMKKHEIKPTLDHYACMVDLYARSGHIYKAERFLSAMECPPSNFIMMSLLTASKIYGELDMGQRCFQFLLELSQDIAAACLLMGEIYANAGRWQDASRVEEMRISAGAKKKPGSAMIEVNMEMHEFVVGVNCNPLLSLFLKSILVKDEGYIAYLVVSGETIYEDKDAQN